MKILRVIARLNVGGPARHVVWLTAGMKSSGMETVLVAGVVPAGEDDMNYFAEAAGVRPVIIPEMSREISLKDFLTVWKLFRLMVRERPDIVHTHTAKAGTVGRVAGMFYRWLTWSSLVAKPRPCRFVHTYHGHVFHSYYGPLKTRLFLSIERLLARFATDRIVVVSEQQRREINERFGVGRPQQFAVIPLGIDLGTFADWQTRRPEMRARLGADEHDLLVAIVGRLTEVKNHSMFLRAAARLKDIYRKRNQRDDLTPRVRFLIVGDGGLRSELEAQAKILGIDDDVQFLGSRDDAESLYGAFDIVALTSLNEGTPLTVIEAMAGARPVIATAVGGVVDLIGTRTNEKNIEGYDICERGVLVDSGDAEAFARGLALLIDNQTLRYDLGRRGAEFVNQHNSKERLFTDMLDLYRGLIGPAKTVLTGDSISNDAAYKSGTAS
jgi:glycosyltransferase involved in cell wall biosynthesis